MKKERAKNLILAVLVISSLVLTSQLWFSEKLWPEGYNFFVSREGISVAGMIKSLFHQNDATAQPERDLIVPHSLICYMVKDFDHVAVRFNMVDEQYASAMNIAKASLCSALAGDSKRMSMASEEDWKRALSQNGIYVDLGESYVSDTLYTLLGGEKVSSLPIKIGGITRFAVVPAESVTNEVYLYFQDTATFDYYKILTDTQKCELEATLASASEYAGVTNSFSFSIQTDKAVEGGNEFVFDPYIMISSDTPVLPEIKCDNPLDDNNPDKPASQIIDRLLKRFSLNPSTVRRYTDANGEMVFVQNHATLKISADGSLEYRASAQSRGFTPDGSSANVTAAYTTAAYAVNQTAQLAQDILEDYGIASTSVYVGNVRENPMSCNVNLDYYVNGIKIVQPKNAVTALVNNGYIIEYTQKIRNYIITGKNRTCLSTLGAIDDIFANIAPEQRPSSYVNDMFIGYYDNGENKTVRPEWFVKLNGSDTYYR